MRENFQGVVHVPDFPVDVVKDFVQFIYTGVAPNLEKHAVELFAIADKVKPKYLLRLPITIRNKHGCQ